MATGTVELCRLYAPIITLVAKNNNKKTCSFFIGFNFHSSNLEVAVVREGSRSLTGPPSTSWQCSGSHQWPLPVPGLRAPSTYTASGLRALAVPPARSPTDPMSGCQSFLFKEASLIHIRAHCCLAQPICSSGQGSRACP